jgi:hypothetical protein
MARFGAERLDSFQKLSQMPGGPQCNARCTAINYMSEIAPISIQSHPDAPAFDTHFYSTAAAADYWPLLLQMRVLQNILSAQKLLFQACSFFCPCNVQPKTS